MFGHTLAFTVYQIVGGQKGNDTTTPLGEDPYGGERFGNDLFLQPTNNRYTLVTLTDVVKAVTSQPNCPNWQLTLVKVQPQDIGAIAPDATVAFWIERMRTTEAIEVAVPAVITAYAKYADAELPRQRKHLSSHPDAKTK